MADAEHPREAVRLQRTEAAAAAFLAALQRGRLHHAWLITGPQGLGKASFAYQAAKRLLGAKPTGGEDRLASAPDDSVSRMVAAQSHPDLLVLERTVEGQPARKAISVDDARRLPEFFAKSPAIAPFRIAVIDAADDLNVNAANAVLKTLEEPSGRGVLFLVSHAPGRLLATIRSRCRRVAFEPWTEPELVSFGRTRLALEEGQAQRLARMAKGAPGRMSQLAAAGALRLDDVAGALLATDGSTQRSEALRLADGFRGGEGAQSFALIFDRLADRLRTAALDAPSLTSAQELAGLQRQAARMAGQVEALNLDRSDAFWSFLAEVRSTMRGFGKAEC